MCSLSYYDLLYQANLNYPENIAIIQYDNGVYKKYTYNDLFQISTCIFEHITSKICSGDNVGILIEHMFMLPAIISAIHKCGAIFTFLNPNNQQNAAIVRELKINHIFALDNKTFDGFTSTNISNLCRQIYLWTSANFDRTTIPKNSNNIAYCIKTSGSTGIAKCVAVTHESIMPNILDFEIMFNVKSTDVIYFSTPLTFDPSIIELYLAVKCYASLLIATEILDVIFSDAYGITIWQTTPSKFILHGVDNIRNRILNEHTSLRILALGGEVVYYDVCNFAHDKNKTELYNLYGITEISCWATIKKINGVNFEDYNILGNALTQTLIRICDDNNQKAKIGNILIGSSTRKCLIDDEIHCSNHSLVKDDIIWRKTGDLGEEINNFIYFKGRKDNIIKRYGHKINVLDIEMISLKFIGIEQCVCLWNIETHKLILFYKCNSNINEKDYSSYLHTILDTFSVPDNIIRIDNIPLNENGKISKKELWNYYKKNMNNLENITSFKTIFLNLLSDALSITEHFIEEHGDRSFLQVGGTSIMAVQLATKLEKITKQSVTNLYQILINPLYSISRMIDIINMSSETSNGYIIQKGQKRLHEENQQSKNEGESITFKFSVEHFWKYNTGKCVDANITIYKDKYALVGSHSGEIVFLDTSSGVKLFSKNVGSRVEAPVFCYDKDSIGLAVVGCYDGSLWCFNIEEPKVVWKVNLGSMIKSRANKTNDTICVATYDSILYRIDIKTGDILSCIKIGTKGISADITCFYNNVYIGTLDGVCVKVDENLGDIKWKHILESPVFAKATIVRNGSQVVFNEVNSKIHCFDIDSGNKMWTFNDAQGLIFSSCSLLSRNNSYSLVFGCHDCHTYKITCAENDIPALDWRVHNISQIYATPFIDDDIYVITISTNGSLQIIDMSSGELRAEFPLPGEVYSSPIVVNNFIYAGCRDNNVYCMRIIKKKYFT